MSLTRSSAWMPFWYMCALFGGLIGVYGPLTLRIAGLILIVISATAYVGIRGLLHRELSIVVWITAVLVFTQVLNPHVHDVNRLRIYLFGFVAGYVSFGLACHHIHFRSWFFTASFLGVLLAVVGISGAANVLVQLFSSRSTQEVFSFFLREGTTVYRGNRIHLPMGTPPMLSFVLGLLVLTIANLKSRIGLSFGLRATLLAIMLSLLVFAGSLTGIVGLTIVVLWYSLKAFLRLDWSLRKLLPLIGFPLFILAALLFFHYSGTRSITSVTTSIERHALLRIATLGAMSEWSMGTWLYGVGAGHSSYYIPGAYSFTVPLTIAFEFGLFGILAMLHYYSTIYRLSQRKRLKGFFLYVLMSSLFYQLNNEVAFFILPVVLLAAVPNRDTIQITDSSGKEISQTNGVVPCA